MIPRKFWTGAAVIGALALIFVFEICFKNFLNIPRSAAPAPYRWGSYKYCNQSVIFDKFSQGLHRNGSNQVTEKEDSHQHLAHPHRDLYTRNLTLINIKNFKFLINNDICNVTPVAIVTIVHSSVENAKAREIIRFVV